MVNVRVVLLLLASGFVLGCMPESGPQIVLTSPVNGGTEVAVDARILVAFSEPMAERGEVELQANDATLGALLEWTSENRITIRPTLNLPRLSLITVNLAGFESAAGQALPDSSFSFQTGDPCTNDSERPRLTSPLTQQFDDRNAVVSRLTFNEAMTPFDPSALAWTGDADSVDVVWLSSTQAQLVFGGVATNQRLVVTFSDQVTDLCANPLEPAELAVIVEPTSVPPSAQWQTPLNPNCTPSDLVSWEIQFTRPMLAGEAVLLPGESRYPLVAGESILTIPAPATAAGETWTVRFADSMDSSPLRLTIPSDFELTLTLRDEPSSVPVTQPAGGVSGAHPLIIDFPVPVNPVTGRIQISENGNDLSDRLTVWQWNDDNTQVTIAWQNPLRPMTITPVDVVADQFLTPCGWELSAASWSYTIDPAADQSPPTAALRAPTQTSCVDQELAAVEVEFSEPMENTGEIVVTNGGTELARTTPNSGATLVSLPLPPLQTGDLISVTLVDLEDQSFNQLDPPNSFAFTVGDPLPKVQSLTPAAGSTIRLDTPIVARFDRGLDPSAGQISVALNGSPGSTLSANLLTWSTANHANDTVSVRLDQLGAAFGDAVALTFSNFRTPGASCAIEPISHTLQAKDPCAVTSTSVNGFMTSDRVHSCRAGYDWTSCLSALPHSIGPPVPGHVWVSKNFQIQAPGNYLCDMEVTLGVGTVSDSAADIRFELETPDGAYLHLGCDGFPANSTITLTDAATDVISDATTGTTAQPSEAFANLVGMDPKPTVNGGFWTFKFGDMNIQRPNPPTPPACSGDEDWVLTQWTITTEVGSY